MDAPAPRTPLQVGAALLALLLLVAAAWIARNVLLLAFFAVVIATVLSLPVGLLQRWIPRWAALLLVLAVVLGGLVLLGVLVAPTLVEQAHQLRDQIPEALDQLERWRGQLTGGTGQAQGDGGDGGALPIPDQVKESAVPAVFAIGQGLSSVVLVTILAVFLASSPHGYRRGLRRLVPDAWLETFDGAVDRVAHDHRGWVRGVSVSMAINGVGVAIGMWAIGLDQWLLLGVITLICSFVPYIGAFASAVPAVVIALPLGWGKVAWALGVYTAVQMFEGYVLTPLVMRRAVDVKPALLLLGQGVMTALFGLMGTVVATPLVVCLQALVGYLWVERALGRDPHGT
ncbi:MAG: AI-2E family transporter [Myxococcota bacterium]